MTTGNELLYSDWAIPPGEGLLEEIEFRGISPQELAPSLGLHVEAVKEIIVGERAITTRHRRQIGDHFGHIGATLA